MFSLFTSFFTEVLSGDEWLKLVDHIFLSQSILFVYIIISVFTARQMSLVFDVTLRERHIGLQKVDDILRVAYIIYDSFNTKYNPDIYMD